MKLNPSSPLVKVANAKGTSRNRMAHAVRNCSTEIAEASKTLPRALPQRDSDEMSSSTALAKQMKRSATAKGETNLKENAKLRAIAFEITSLPA